MDSGYTLVTSWLWCRLGEKYMDDEHCGHDERGLHTGAVATETGTYRYEATKIERPRVARARNDLVGVQ